MSKILTQHGLREMTSNEQTLYDAKKQAWNDASAERKLEQIKEMRLERLQETDYYALQDVTMPDNVKTWRQTLRDLPANHSDEAAYDLLLARETDKTKNTFGQLTHSIWSKP